MFLPYYYNIDIKKKNMFLIIYIIGVKNKSLIFSVLDVW